MAVVSIEETKERLLTRSVDRARESHSTVAALREIIAQARAQADKITVYLLEQALREILKARRNWRDGGDDA